MHNQKLVTIIVTVCAFIGCLAHSIAAQQDDRCRDVLRNGVFATMKYEEKNYFQQVVWSRFLSSSYESSKTDKSLGFTVPLGEIVMGGNYTEGQFKAKQRQIQNENFQRIEANNEIDTFHTFGDPTIVREWGKCMSERGGLSLTFVKNSPTEVTAVLQWHAVGGVTETQLNQNINLPNGAVFTNGSRPLCFETGVPLRASVPCVITITLPNAVQTLQWGITTTNGAARAYLPPRIELRREKKFYIPTDPDYQLYREKKRETVSPTITLEMSEQELNDGWIFDSTSARVSLIDMRTLDNNSCNLTDFTADAHTFTYGLRIIGNTRRPGRNSAAVCKVKPSIMMFRDFWVAQASATN